ncbi:Asp23/Gls24 family envelope stress response protein [Amycolatopsis sp. FDAARGOS 1241]|uniref:Asp23/Gls24 family envelope stress response protein n=1 Tax=Amycolatopsis sp. FDAARGOS 1241 TaxID=2778070 RepID=UPI001950D118|nr:Asp23/Gls24 family envelope stress response protein [Amycolatopsis sp. FDAARGOS 1241]QRP46237.1 Asp23/Gls24 family envelope stress response protein [Amycolatopsis sp. FDAARGOS 1241]
MADLRENSTTTAEKPAALVVAPRFVTEQGTTTIADAVVRKIAGATRPVCTRSAARWRGRSARCATHPRHVGERGTGRGCGGRQKQAAVALEIVVEYGVALAELVRRVRRDVTDAIERMTDLEVVEVNVAVSDVHLADEEPTASDRVW